MQSVKGIFTEMLHRLSHFLVGTFCFFVKIVLLSLLQLYIKSVTLVVVTVV